MAMWEEHGHTYGLRGEIFHCLKCDYPYYQLSADRLCANCRVRMEKRMKNWRQRQADTGKGKNG